MMGLNLRIILNLRVVACFLMPLSSTVQGSTPEKRPVSIDDQARFQTVGSPVALTAAP